MRESKRNWILKPFRYIWKGLNIYFTLLILVVFFVILYKDPNVAEFSVSFKGIHVKYFEKFNLGKHVFELYNGDSKMLFDEEFLIKVSGTEYSSAYVIFDRIYGDSDNSFNNDKYELLKVGECLSKIVGSKWYGVRLLSIKFDSRGSSNNKVVFQYFKSDNKPNY